jgi:hypothetical protein
LQIAHPFQYQQQHHHHHPCQSGCWHASIHHRIFIIQYTGREERLIAFEAVTEEGLRDNLQENPFYYFFNYILSILHCKI